jgi:hypothetical protein
LLSRPLEPAEQANARNVPHASSSFLMARVMRAALPIDHTGGC